MSGPATYLNLLPGCETSGKTANGGLQRTRQGNKCESFLFSKTVSLQPGHFMFPPHLTVLSSDVCGLKWQRKLWESCPRL